MAVQGFQADGTALVKLVKQRLEVSRRLRLVRVTRLLGMEGWDGREVSSEGGRANGMEGSEFQCSSLGEGSWVRYPPSSLLAPAPGLSVQDSSSSSGSELQDRAQSAITADLRDYPGGLVSPDARWDPTRGLQRRLDGMLEPLELRASQPTVHAP